MGRRLRLLHIGNGKAFKIRAIVDAMLERGHELHMVSIPPMDMHWEGVASHRLPDPPLPGPAKVLARMLQVRALARDLQPDVVHAHNAWGPGWYGAFAAVAPLVIHAYGGDLLPEQYGRRPMFQRCMTSWACNRASKIIVTGEHMIGASQTLHVPRERITLLSRGVDLKRFNPERDASALRNSLRIPEGSPVVLSPRYQVDEAIYNLDTVVAAFAFVKQQLPNAVCVQLYDPDRFTGMARLQKLALAQGMEASYLLVPAVDNASMPPFYRLATVVVSVPSSDGFPVTVLEASACGAPLVVSELPYCAEWFTHGQNGLLVPPGDARALADAVLAICTDRELASRFAAAGRRMACERADYDRCMSSLEGLYLGLSRPAFSPFAG